MNQIFEDLLITFEIVCTTKFIIYITINHFRHIYHSATNKTNSYAMVI